MKTIDMNFRPASCCGNCFFSTEAYDDKSNTIVQICKVDGQDTDPQCVCGLFNATEDDVMEWQWQLVNEIGMNGDKLERK